MIRWRKDRLPTPVFLGFPDGSAGKEPARNAGNLDSIPGLGRSTGERNWLPAPVFWPGELHGLYSPWGHKELDTTEQIAPQTTALASFISSALEWFWSPPPAQCYEPLSIVLQALPLQI